MNDLQKASIKQIADHYGIQHQVDKAFEELNELKEELAAYYFRFLDNDEDISLVGMIDEITDVEIMLEQLKYLLKIQKEVHAHIWFKTNRQLELIREEGVQIDCDDKFILTSALEEVERLGAE